MSRSYGEQGLGVVFDITALEEEYTLRTLKTGADFDPEKATKGLLYGGAAWNILMRIIHPRQITPSILLEGDTWLTLKRHANEFCIALYGDNLDLETLREQVLVASDYGLAPFHRRLIEKIALDRQPLVFFGRIDWAGRLVTEEWTRADQTLCKASGWLYAPQKVPKDLDPALAAELLEMRFPRIG